MLRSLWSASSGLQSQQFAVNTVADNLANINTTGFKASRPGFADLVYELEMGNGVRTTSPTVDTTEGSLQATGRNLDLAITGQAYFKVQKNGQQFYTRDGKLNIDAQGYLVTSDGYQVLNRSGQPVRLPATTSSVKINAAGQVTASVPGGPDVTLGALSLNSFPNLEALGRVGGGRFVPTAASGQAQQVQAGQGQPVQVKQGFLEGSNVDLARSMTRLIRAQRVLQLNAREVSTTDQMLAVVNSIQP